MKTSLRLLLLAVFAVLFVGTASAHYNPQLGRWLSRDPMGEAGGFNLYAYCGNDPVNKHDPLGLFALSEIFGLPGNEATSPAEAQFRKVLQATLIYDLLTYTCYPNEIEAALIKASNAVADSGQGAELAAFYRQKICGWQTASSEYIQKLDAIYNSPRYKIKEALIGGIKGTGEATGFNSVVRAIGHWDLMTGEWDYEPGWAALDLGLVLIPEMRGTRILARLESGVLRLQRNAIGLEFDVARSGMAFGASEIAAIPNRTLLMRQKLVRQMAAELGYNPDKVVYKHSQDLFRGGSVDSMGNIVIDGYAFDAGFLAKYGISGPREILAHEIGHTVAGIANESGASLMGAVNSGLTRNQSLNLFRDYRMRLGGN